MPAPTASVVSPTSAVGTAPRDISPYSSGSYPCRALVYSNATPSAAGLRSTVVPRELDHIAPHGVHHRGLPLIRCQLDVASQLLNLTRRIVPYVSLPLRRQPWLLAPNLKRFIRLTSLCAHPSQSANDSALDAGGVYGGGREQ